MNSTLSKYSVRHYRVMLVAVLPFAIFLNSLILGKAYFTDGREFALSTLIMSIVFCADFILCISFIPVFERRFPREEQATIRIAIVIAICLSFTAVFLLAVFHLYKNVNLFNYNFQKSDFVWAFVGMGMTNIFLTFLLEGIARYERWEAKFLENELIKKAHQQSKLQGLKSQASPHFLFNCLNSLSTLINRSPSDANRFLDKLSKVYRYLLQIEDDELVAVDKELNFLEAYYHLMKTRYGEGIKLSISINEEQRNKLIPSLALQVLIENAFAQNVMATNQPLSINIESCSAGLKVCNKKQLKKMYREDQFDSGIEQLINRYALMHGAKVIVENTEDERIIYLPLFDGKESREEVL